MHILLAKLTVFMMVFLIIHRIAKISRFARHHRISLIVRNIAEILIFYTAITALFIIISFLLIGNANTVMYYYHNNNIAVPIIIFIAAVLNIIKIHTY